MEVDVLYDTLILLPIRFFGHYVSSNFHNSGIIIFEETIIVKVLHLLPISNEIGRYNFLLLKIVYSLVHIADRCPYLAIVLWVALFGNYSWMTRTHCHGVRSLECGGNVDWAYLVLSSAVVDVGRLRGIEFVRILLNEIDHVT